MKKRSKKRLQGAMYGVRPASVESSIALDKSFYAKRCFRISRASRPPSYIVERVFRELGGYAIERIADKSTWRTWLTFEGFTWLVRDWRRGTLDVFVLYDGSPEEGVELPAGIVKKLLGKLEAASRIVDGALAEVGAELIKAGEFSLQNTFDRAIRMYEQSRAQAESIVADIQVDPISTWRLRDTLGAPCLASVVFFFAATEVLLDCCYSLQPPVGLSYTDFRSSPWRVRVCKFLPISTGSGQAIYQRINDIRREYRNMGAHAEPTYLVELPDVGLAPVSYDGYDSPRMAWGSSITAAEASEIFESFDRFFELLRDNDLGWYAFQLAESSLPIPLAPSGASYYRSKIGDRDGFCRVLEQRLRYRDMVENCEV